MTKPLALPRVTQPSLMTIHRLRMLPSIGLTEKSSWARLLAYQRLLSRRVACNIVMGEAAAVAAAAAAVAGVMVEGPVEVAEVEVAVGRQRDQEIGLAKVAAT